jgi:hypothetical protein
MLPFSFKWQLHIATTFHARVVEPTQLCKDLITAQVSTTWTRSNPTLPRLSIINEDETGARPFKGSVRYNYRLRFAEALPRTA